MKAASQLTDSRLARKLAGARKLGTLCTWSARPEGYPFGSLLPYILDGQGNPIFIASNLAEHTGNFIRDPRASLFVADGDDDNALARERVTLLGKVEEIEPDIYRAQYLEAHPEAAAYIDMKDFSFYRLSVEVVRYVGGFGRMSWIEHQQYASEMEQQ